MFDLPAKWMLVHVYYNSSQLRALLATLDLPDILHNRWWVALILATSEPHNNTIGWCAAQITYTWDDNQDIISYVTLLSWNKVLMTKLYGYDRNDDGIMLNKRIYWEHPKVLMRSWIHSLNQCNNVSPRDPYSTWKCHICMLSITWSLYFMIVGTHCEKRVYDCSVHSCQNGGSCLPQGESNYTCRCRPTYSGAYCQYQTGKTNFIQSYFPVFLIPLLLCISPVLPSPHLFCPFSDHQSGVSSEVWGVLFSSSIEVPKLCHSGNLFHMINSNLSY